LSTVIARQQQAVAEDVNPVEITQRQQAPAQLNAL